MKQEITTEIDIPKGYRFVQLGVPKIGEFYLRPNGDVLEVDTAFGEGLYFIVVEKIKPRTKTFVCISEELRCGLAGEYYETHEGKLYAVNKDSTAGVYKIWKEVEE